MVNKAKYGTLSVTSQAPNGEQEAREKPSAGPSSASSHSKSQKGKGNYGNVHTAGLDAQFSSFAENQIFVVTFAFFCIVVHTTTTTEY